MADENLSQLREGESALVSLLTHQDGIRRRLQDLGLVEGTRVHCIHKSPFGDPTAYGVRGAVIALRSEDASGVLVDRSQNGERG